jgi:hypothetical protein
MYQDVLDGLYLAVLNSKTRGIVVELTGIVILVNFIGVALVLVVTIAGP